jgi:hypothetical protein
LLFEATRQESVALRAAIASASPDWRQALEEWERLRHHYSTVALQSGSEAGRLARPEHKEVDPAEMLSLRDRIEQLEQRLRRDNPAYALQSRLQQVSLEQVQQALRSGEALDRIRPLLHS